MAASSYISLYFMSAVYIVAGINHFLNPKFYLKITPKWITSPEKVNLLVGAFEIILGVGLLISSMQRFAAIGIIALLIAVFPANLYHYQIVKRNGKNVITTLIRLPIQALLIYWAYTFI